MSTDICARPVHVTTILGGDMRLEASTYLRSGYGFVRLARHATGTVELGDLADIWQPSRLTGYTVAEGKGLPFFTAGQVFEDFPRVRKWLAKPFIPQADERYADTDWLLLSCSGVVGRVTAVYPHHLGKIITHDLLRVVPKDAAEYGWLYAYMKTDFFQQIAQAAQYGHMIKHIEVAHAAAFPVIMPDKRVRRAIGDIAVDAVGKRSHAWELRDKAFVALEKALGARGGVMPSASTRSIVRLSSIMRSRLRLDADYYEGSVTDAEKLVSDHSTSTLGDVTLFASDLGRFARVYGDGGMPYVGASELFDVNAKPTKHIYAKLVREWKKYLLHKGTIIMACSGQKYGVIGRCLMLTENHEGLFGSHDLIRIVPDASKMRSGYLLTFLNDPLIGRPCVVRNAYGTSVPHLDPGDVRKIRIPRLGEDVENAIADLMDQSVTLSAEADRLENKTISLAQKEIDKAIS